MATGYLLRGVCHPTANDAALTFRSDFPKIDGGQIWNLKANPVVAGSTISYILEDTKAGAGNDITGTLTLLSCDTATVPSDPMFTVILFAACAVMFGLGFIGTR